MDDASTPPAEHAFAAGLYGPLALAAAVLLVGESLKLDRTAAGPFVEAAVAGAALVVVWLRRDELRLAPVLAIGIAFQLAWVAIHLGLDVRGDPDPRLVYPTEGHAVLDGHFPASPYPPGAVALFALETWLGGGTARTANAFLMVPFQAACVVGIWLLRTRWSPWLATVVALWPLNAFFWEFRFDLVPAAAIAVGVALAWHMRWRASGLVLGLGTVMKWTPALTAVAIAAWLAVSGARRSAIRHVIAFALPIFVVYIPLLALDPDAAVAPYRAQGARGITGESLPYLPLRALGLAHPARHYYGPAHVGHWGNVLAGALQAVAVLAVVARAAVARSRAAALALAALAPAVFLLTNRIFSPQFFVVVVVACVVAAALTLTTKRDLGVAVALVGVGTVANALLFPRLSGAASGWVWVSAAALLPATGAVIRLARA